MFRRLVLVAVLLFASVAPAYARDRAVLVYPREHSIFRRIFYTTHQRALRQRIGAQYDLDVHEQVATDDAIFAIDVDGAKRSFSPATATRSGCTSRDAGAARSTPATA